jgi:hypothetical protein
LLLPALCGGILPFVTTHDPASLSAGSFFMLIR